MGQYENRIQTSERGEGSLLMIKMFLILVLIIGANRADHPISIGNSTVFSLCNYWDKCERNITMSAIKEIWRDIKGYEKYYQVSNFGRIKALYREWTTSYGGKRSSTERILNGNNGGRYLQVALSKNSGRKSHPIHCLVWDHFGDKPRQGRELQIDHIDGNKWNNNIKNLRLVTPRENIISAVTKNKKKKLPIGVSYNKKHKKYAAQIEINNKKLWLGYYNKAEYAGVAYNIARNLFTIINK